MSSDQDYPDLTCFVCGLDLDEPYNPGGPWMCPDENCNSHQGN